MAQPAAKQGDKILATDTHIVLVPSPGGPVPTPTPFPFNGLIDGSLSSNVRIMGLPAATVGSQASNTPPHFTPPPTTLQVPPTNKGVILKGSSSVFINRKPAARSGDPAQTCADPTPNLGAKVVATGTVLIGG
jgi:uncharacterized Zn-binding protein involved in type VI secretion